MIAKWNIHKHMYNYKKKKKPREKTEHAKS